LRGALAALAILAGCASGLSLQHHSLAGKIWDPRARAFVTEAQVLERAAASRRVLLGETHDNPEHHRLQREVLDALARRGPLRALAMEQFDSEHQSALDAARERGVNAEQLADAGKFDREGWHWPLYRPLVEFALEHRWPLVAANLSRAEARAIVLEPSRSGLPPADPALRAALESDMIEGHCGARPEAKRLAGLVEAQRARDALMARSIEPQSSVLIAGAGHVRRDRGVPRYLRDSNVLSIAFIEVEAGKDRPQDYSLDATYDYVWFTARAEREDPCASAPGRDAEARQDRQGLRRQGRLSAGVRVRRGRAPRGRSRSRPSRRSDRGRKAARCHTPAAGAVRAKRRDP